MLYNQIPTQMLTSPEKREVKGQSLVNPSQSLVQSLVSKNTDFEGFLGKEGVIFFNDNLQGPYKHVFK